jgi:hypothetical protein
MIPSVVIQTTQKDGNDQGENEDRGAFRVESPKLRLAVADGATESSFSDLWAEALVSVAVGGPSTSPSDPIAFDVALEQYRSQLPSAESLPWYAEAKLAAGSHAALAVVSIGQRHSGYHWRARVIGDCQLFVLKPKGRYRLIRAFPAASASAFGFHPALVPTDPSQWASLPIVKASGELHPPFEVWLTTDALAHACLAAHEGGGSPWAEWAAASESADAFEELVARKRAEGAMRNDDVTLVRAWLS